MLIFHTDIDPARLPEQDIIAFAESEAVTADVVREYIITRLLRDENALSRLCEEGHAPGASLRAAALSDIARLLPSRPATPLLDGYAPSVRRQMPFAAYQRSLDAAVLAQTHKALLDALIAHYRAFGGGAGARCVAFLWEEGGLRGVERPDPIALDDLIGLETQKAEMAANIEAFLARRPACNTLLYGNGGCGKSSMVKAILGAYYPQGLRLVQLAKEDLSALPRLLRALSGRLFRYIVFLDDLSFEGDDLSYKPLKTVLDGGIEPQPENVLICATSNRLHLVSESWAEREGRDVHVKDTQHEKLSLSERFGLRLSFLSPVQAEYVTIVEGILAGRGAVMTDAMREEAVRWAWGQNGLSGRTAAQYADYVLGTRIIQEKDGTNDAN